MDKLIRNHWFRLITVFMGMTGVVALYPFLDSSELNDSISAALRACTLLFAVCTALSLAVLNNYICGLKEAATNRIYEIRSRLELLFDEFSDSSDPEIQKIVESYLIPLLGISTSQWHTYAPVRPILENIYEPLSNLHQRNPTIVPRYFLRLEDEINELGLLFIRRIIASLHIKTIKGALYLVALGIAVIFLSAVLPPYEPFVVVSILSATGITIFTILELLLLVSFISQEAREELPEEDEEEVEGENQ